MSDNTDKTPREIELEGMIKLGRETEDQMVFELARHREEVGKLVQEHTNLVNARRAGRCDAPIMNGSLCGELAEFELSIFEPASGEPPHMIYRCYQHTEAIKRSTRLSAGYSPNKRFRVLSVEPINK